MNEAYRKELLMSALEARVREVTEYQVNIDNFRMALDACRDEADMSVFRDQLQELLTSSIYEQRKALIMLSVVQKQVEAGYVG